MLLLGIHHQKQLVRNLAKRKFYSIVGTDFEFEALAMHMASRVRAKLGGMTHQAKPLEKPRGMREK